MPGEFSNAESVSILSLYEMHSHWDETEVVKDKQEWSSLGLVCSVFFVGFCPIKNERKSMAHEENVSDKIKRLMKIRIFISS